MQLSGTIGRLIVYAPSEEAVIEFRSLTKVGVEGRFGYVARGAYPSRGQVE